MDKHYGIEDEAMALVGKRAYATPRMVQYGEISQLTASGSITAPNESAAAGMADCGGSMSFNVNVICPT